MDQKQSNEWKDKTKFLNSNPLPRTSENLHNWKNPAVCFSASWRTNQTVPSPSVFTISWAGVAYHKQYLVWPVMDELIGKHFLASEFNWPSLVSNHQFQLLPSQVGLKMHAQITSHLPHHTLLCAHAFILSLYQITFGWNRSTFWFHGSLNYVIWQQWWPSQGSWNLHTALPSKLTHISWRNFYSKHGVKYQQEKKKSEQHYECHPLHNFP